MKKSSTFVNQIEIVADELFSLFKKDNLTSDRLKYYLELLNIAITISQGRQFLISNHLEALGNLLKEKKIIFVKAATGTGKSTLIPFFLKNQGFKKVIVSQPNKLYCQHICKKTDLFFGKNSSDYFSGNEINLDNQGLLFTTNALLLATVMQN